MFCWSLKPILYRPGPVTCIYWSTGRFIFLFLLQLVFWKTGKKSCLVCETNRLILSCCFQVSTFIMMYRTHCQRILDTVIRANFDEARFLSFEAIRGFKWNKNKCLKTSTLPPRDADITSCVAPAGPKLPAALLAGHAAPHAARPRLPHSGEHRGSLWLHPLQGHLRGPDAHRPASTAWQVCSPSGGVKIVYCI